MTEAHTSKGLIEEVARAIFPLCAPRNGVGCCFAPDFDKCTECTLEVRDIARIAIQVSRSGLYGENARLRLACRAARGWISHAAECEKARLHGGPDKCTCDFEGVKAMLDAVISEPPPN